MQYLLNKIEWTQDETLSTNKSNIKKRKFVLTLFAALVTLACFGVVAYVALYKILPVTLPQDYVDEVYNYGDHIETGYVGFEAETIIEALDQDSTTPFFHLDSISETSVEKLPSGTFPWKQTDYMTIGDKLFEFVWKENSNNWLLHSMEFTVKRCSDISSGFDQGLIVYFLPTDTNGEDQYTARDLLINPLSGYAIWGKTWNYPQSFEWRSINPDNVKITAEEALEIAESHGGLEIRSRAMNNCMITLSLSPDYSRSFGSSWDVIYYDGGYRVFYIVIDSDTGNYQIIKTDK